jgi:hypothetical protein
MGSNDVISGIMPRWVRNLHLFSFVVMLILFLSLTLLILWSFRLAGNGQAFKGMLVISFWFVAIVVLGIGAQTWFWGRLVKEFSYDGYTLQFRTLGRPAIQTRRLAEIASISQWRGGRGGPLGYRIKFRDRTKIYVQYSVSGSALATERITQALHERDG